MADEKGILVEAQPAPIPSRAPRRIPLSLAQRRTLIGLADAVALTAALLAAALAWAWWSGVETRYEFSQHSWMLLLVPAWMICGLAVGAYEIVGVTGMRRSVGGVLVTGLAVFVIYQAVYFFAPRDAFLRLVVIFYVPAAIVLVLAVRWAMTAALARPEFRRRALVIGSEWDRRLVGRMVGRFGSHMYETVGGAAVSDTPQAQPLSDLVRESRVTDLVLAGASAADGVLMEELVECRLGGARIQTVADLYEDLTGQVAINHVGVDFIGRVMGGDGSGLYTVGKRALDLVGALVGLTILAAALLFVAPAMWITMPGPIFYSQERLGRGGRRFRLRKLRTMVVDAEKLTGAVWAGRDDPRVTRLGKLLRKTGLDEFPQFWNVLAGDMSLVGPRPERPELAHQLADLHPLFPLRNLVKGGLTGWALVNSGYARTVNSGLVKLRYDLYYVKHRSFWMDTAIILRTVGLMLTMRRGRA